MHEDHVAGFPRQLAYGDPDTVQHRLITPGAGGPRHTSDSQGYAAVSAERTSAGRQTPVVAMCRLTNRCEPSSTTTVPPPAGPSSASVTAVGDHPRPEIDVSRTS
jgi:hypothetical protein